MTTLASHELIGVKIFLIIVLIYSVNSFIIEIKIRRQRIHSQLQYKEKHRVQSFFTQIYGKIIEINQLY